MNRKGITTIEVFVWMLGAVATAIAYTHSTFITYREVAPRLDRIENKIDSILETGKAK